MKKLRFLNLSIIFALVATMFAGIAKADAILITSKSPKSPGHNSIISQDEYGKWHYFFWGHSASYEQEVPSKYMKNINTFNEWLYKQKKDGTKPKKSYSFYTRATYIRGDFSETTKYYKKKIRSHSTLRYYLGLNFCSVISRKALEKGTLGDGTSFKDLLESNEDFCDYIPFYDYFPVNLHNLVDKSVKDTVYEGLPYWGIVTNPQIIEKMKGSNTSSS
ncbi:MAG: hypothetical protein Q4D57_02265 [Clostridia bacterium]|nr:hypothetical protein [Clostridia bacterium]